MSSTTSFGGLAGFGPSSVRARAGAPRGRFEQGIHCSPPEGSHMESLVGSLAKSASVFGDGLSARRYASGSESRMRLANSNPIGVAILIPAALFRDSE